MKNKIIMGLFIASITIAALTGCTDSALQEESYPINSKGNAETIPTENGYTEDVSLSVTDTEVSDKSITISYVGEDFIKSVFAVGGNMLYVYGMKPNGNYFLGCMQKEGNVFQELDVDMDEDMRAFNMVIDKQNRCHILWMSIEKDVFNDQSFDRITYEKSEITIVNSEGKLEKKIEVSDIFSSEQSRPICFVVDEEGNYYFENGKEIVQILSDGTQGKVGVCNGIIEGIGTGKSGIIYCIYHKESGARELAKLEEGSLHPCYEELPNANAIYAGVYAGTDSELLLFNKDSGILAYDGEGVQIRVPGTELPVSRSMINGYGILSDGRTCIMTQAEGTTTFYYIPSGK